MFTGQNFLRLWKLLTQTIKIEKIHNLYINEMTVMKAEKGNNQVEAKIAKNVRQGCNLSPTLFNLYIEETLK